MQEYIYIYHNFYVKRNNGVANYTLNNKSIVGFGCKLDNTTTEQVDIKDKYYKKEDSFIEHMV